MYAASSNSQNCAKQLLNQQQMLDKQNNNALVYAILNKSVGIVPMLTNEFTQNINQNNFTPLMLAAVTNYPQINQLFQLSTQIDNQGNTALFYAIKNFNNEVAKQLLQVEKMIKNRQNIDALMIAAQSGNKEMAQYICENERQMLANVDQRNYTAFYYALEQLNKFNPNEELSEKQEQYKQNLLETAKYLGQHQGNQLVQNADFTPLQIFIKFGQTESIQQFIQQQTVLDGSGRTCLMYAVMNQQNTEIINAFMSQKGATDNNGMTALMYACKYGNLQAAEDLSQDEYTIKDKNGFNPVMHAITQNQNEIIELFTTTYEGDLANDDVTSFMIGCKYDSYNCLSYISDESELEDSNGQNWLSYICMNDSNNALATIICENLAEIPQDLIFQLMNKKCYKCIKTVIDLVREAGSYLLKCDVEISSKDQKYLIQILEAKNEFSMNPLEASISMQDWSLVRIFASYYASKITPQGLALSKFMMQDPDMQNQIQYYKAGQALIKYGSIYDKQNKTCSAIVALQNYDKNKASQYFIKLMEDLYERQETYKDSTGKTVQMIRQELNI